MKVSVDKNAVVAGGFALLFVAIVILALSPLAIIWGWNTLFGDIKTIDYTFWNWLAVMALGMMFKTSYYKSK